MGCVVNYLPCGMAIMPAPTITLLRFATHGQNVSLAGGSCSSCAAASVPAAGAASGSNGSCILRGCWVCGKLLRLWGVSSTSTARQPDTGFESILWLGQVFAQAKGGGGVQARSSQDVFIGKRSKSYTSCAC